MNFSVIKRNPGHWDITTKDGRDFAIRGGPGKYYVRDEREGDARGETRRFKSLQACMTFVCDELMYELIVAEGQKPTMIEFWNV